jgi:energy-converting hydrogenase A subunit O
MVFIEGMEAMNRIEVTPRAAYLRVIANELDRIQSHLLANFSYCYTIEHETLGMYLLNVREKAMDLLERLTGARVNKAYMIPGGVRFDLQEEDHAFISSTLNQIEPDIERYTRMFSEGPLIGLRSRGIGKLTVAHAKEAHAVGPTARASGIPVDLRTRHPTYKEVGFTPVVRTEGDNFARVMVRFQEISESIGIIHRCLDGLPEGPIQRGGICGAGTTTHQGEAPRGELSYFLKADEYGRIVDIAIQTPSIMNIEASAHYMVIGATSLADVTATFISADPCIACTER